MLGAYDSNLGSSPIPLQAFAIRLVLLNSHQIAASNAMQLATGTTDFGFCAPMCCQIYVQPKGLRMSRQMQSNERGAGCAAYLLGSNYQCIKHSAVHALILCTSVCRTDNGLRNIMHHRLMLFHALFPVHISNKMYQHIKQWLRS